ncbi:Methylated-DNA--protein-cysteine methyltransferase, inducible [Kingella potus]|uniref:Methylated-DNA--protein-cysteine methyltransferase n=1 Tax=Kingella potus TaxID=265175 RepID=A0A377R6Q8_9NEIS|nr:methylated-DNA--[protein]-cysteine S-methyltransferase [Kingella potus]STR03255.1 Methylated-DNA--protein-cysteine methyltransferase, inducible [Kingella potus]
MPVIQTRIFPSPLGKIIACATEQGLCLLEFVGSKRIEREQQELQRLLKRPIAVGGNVHLQQAEAELNEYFSGSRIQFGVALHTPGTPFQTAVWQALQAIPYGKTVSYREQAERIGKPAAVRAVAHANGANRVSVIIPCHRVIGADGSLTGYGGGLQRKQWLLAHERGDAPDNKDLFGESLF